MLLLVYGVISYSWQCNSAFVGRSDLDEALNEMNIILVYPLLIERSCNGFVLHNYNCGAYDI